MKTKFILHGGFTRYDNEQNRAFFSELIRDVPEGGTVLLVYFASEPGDDVDTRFENHKLQIGGQALGKTFNFVLANEGDFEEQLKQSNTVYFNGGDTNILLAILRKYPKFKELVKGKVVAGSSAGAYALAAYGTAHSGEHMRQGLGLVPIRVICHYESSELPPSDSSVAEIMKASAELELIKLKDFEWLVKEIDL